MKITKWKPLGVNLNLIKMRSIIAIIILIILAALALSSCDSYKSGDRVTPRPDEYVVISKESYDSLVKSKSQYPRNIQIKYNLYSNGTGISPNNVQVIKIDSCEYIIGGDNGVYNGGLFLTHKGDCKFCRYEGR